MLNGVASGENQIPQNKLDLDLLYKNFESHTGPYYEIYQKYLHLQNVVANSQNPQHSTEFDQYYVSNKDVINNYKKLHEYVVAHKDEVGIGIVTWPQLFYRAIADHKRELEDVITK